MARIGQVFLGTPSKLEQVSQFTPEQISALKYLLSSGMEGLKNPYQGFEPIASQAQKRFQEQTVPSIAERFTSLGGALSSPSFASQLGQAGAGLSEGLAALQSQYGMQNRSQLMNLINMGLTPQFQHYPVAGEQGALQPILQSLGRLASSALGSLFGLF